jgi:predicted esterase YcpF (UPF0227 family)
VISCFFPCVFQKVRADVKNRAHYDVQDLDVRAALKELEEDTEVVFLAANEDQMVDKRNSEKLYTACPCKKKQILEFTGTHNSKRPPEIMK